MTSTYKNTGYERKLDSKGKPNPKYVDLLEEDKPIAGQKFVCVSFVSPENILKQKEMFLFEEFLKKWDFQKSMEKFNQFLNFISFKYKFKFDDLMTDFRSFVEEEREELMKTTIEDDYKNFLDANEEELEKRFNIDHHFQTTTRGIKVRGSYPTKEEAELRCKMLREIDPNHNIFVGEVGLWLPWDPEPYKTGQVEYMEEELNQLIHEKTKNEMNAKQEFEKRIKETKQKAIEENMKKAELTGNVLTQTIDEEGNLIGIQNVSQGDGNTFITDDRKNEEISAADIRAELFEGENIVVGKSDYGRSELVSGPFANKKKKSD
jgi:hypothetical protein